MKWQHIEFSHLHVLHVLPVQHIIASAGYQSLLTSLFPARYVFHLFLLSFLLLLRNLHLHVPHALASAESHRLHQIDLPRLIHLLFIVCI